MTYDPDHTHQPYTPSAESSDATVSAESGTDAETDGVPVAGAHRPRFLDAWAQDMTEGDDEPVRPIATNDVDVFMTLVSIAFITVGGGFVVAFLWAMWFVLTHAVTYFMGAL
jgi:hypothetical protein